MADRAYDMGPLPRGDRQETLQQKSLIALRTRLPVESFLFRDERIDDKGIDGSLEAKLYAGQIGEDGRFDVFTNCRACVQVKSTRIATLNQDGSASYQIDTANLNYLLNGPCPIYFLWIDSLQEMRYAWARDEWQRLESANHDWKNQSTFTIRFKDILDANALGPIHNRIIAESQLERRIHEILTMSSGSERVAISIDPQTLASEDPRQVFEWITSCGMTIVSSGFGSQVTRWVGILNTDQRANARVQLVAAFALTSLGKYQAALGHLAETTIGRTALSESDQQVLDYLFDVCRYQIGEMSQEEYLRRERDRGNRAGTMGTEHQIEVLRLEWLSEHNSERRAALNQQLREKSRSIALALDTTAAQRVRARLNIMLVDGDDLGRRFLSGVMRIRFRQHIGLPGHERDRQAGLEFANDWQQWDNEARSLVKDAEVARHPLLVAEAITTRLTVYHAYLVTKRMVAFASNTDWKPDVQLLRELIEELKRASLTFRRAGNTEGETRATLLIADMHDLLGDRTIAVELATKSLVVAQAMRYERLVSHAKEYTVGPTSFEQFQANVAARRSEDEDFHLANETDERLLDMARYNLNSLHIPEDRLPVVVREMHSLRLVARERVGWCRHLNIKQELDHMQSPATCFAIDPPRFGVCEKHGYEARIRDSDTETVVGAFKRAYCLGCPDRGPKSKPA